MNAKDKKEISDIAAEIRVFCEKRWAGYTKVRLKHDVRSFAERLEALCNKNASMGSPMEGLKEENEEHMDSEDATLMAEADFPAEGLGKGPTFATDGIFLSERLLAEIKSNPSKFFESKGPLAGQTP